MADRRGDGWNDPFLRRLRAVAALVIVALMAWIIVVEDGPNDVTAVGTLGGMLLVLLGVAALIQWPPK